MSPGEAVVEEHLDHRERARPRRRRRGEGEVARAHQRVKRLGRRIVRSTRPRAILPPCRRARGVRRGFGRRDLHAGPGHRGHDPQHAGRRTSCGLAAAAASRSGTPPGRSPRARVSALLSASEPVFETIKLAGAAYLVYLGVQSLGGPRRRARSCDVRDDPLSPARAFRQGLLEPRESQDRRLLRQPAAPVRARASASFAFLALGFLFCTLGLVWLSVYVVAVDSFARSSRGAPTRAGRDHGHRARRARAPPGDGEEGASR